MVDIEYKTPEMLSDFHFASLWLQYQAQNRPFTLLYELLQGHIHPIFQDNLNDRIVEIREDLGIQESDKQQHETEIKQFQMVAVNKMEKKVNEVDVEYLQADHLVVKEIIQVAQQ